MKYWIRRYYNFWQKHKFLPREISICLKEDEYWIANKSVDDFYSIPLVLSFLPPHYSQQQSDSIFLNFVPKFYPRYLLSLIGGSLFGRAPIDQIAFKKASMPSVKSGQLYKLGLKIFSRKTLARETLVRLSAAVRKASPRSSLEDRTRENGVNRASENTACKRNTSTCTAGLH